MSARVFAPAKINLTLEVGVARDDGYHPVQSLVMFADVGDWIEARASDSLTLKIDGPFAANLDGDNLVMRAARALADVAGVAPIATLTLEKNLPVASGIGGGSSDAAATLKALNALWRLDLGENDLAAIGARLGADVPVCVAAGAAWMSGTGEIVERVEAPSLHAVLVNPLKALPTSRVFAAFDALGLGGGFVTNRAPRLRRPEDMIAFARARGNDLLVPARGLMPEINEMEQALQSDGRVIHVGLSGSGATMFALTAGADEARSVADALSAAYPHWWVRPTTLA